MTTLCRQLLTWLLGISPLFTGCDPVSQDVRITAQDFRFVPAEVHLRAIEPIRLVIVNEGREPHEFTSSLLTDAHVRILSEIEPPEARQGASARILPGRAVRLTLQAPPGTYLFRCQIRGHAGMTGTIVVE